MQGVDPDLALSSWLVLCAFRFLGVMPPASQGCREDTCRAQCTGRRPGGWWR